MSNFMYCCVTLVVINSTAANRRMGGGIYVFPSNRVHETTQQRASLEEYSEVQLYTAACTPSWYSVRCKSRGAVMVAMGGFLPCHHTTSKPGHGTDHPQTVRTSFPCLALSSDALHRRTLQVRVLRIHLLIVEETLNWATTHVLASLA